MVGPSHPSPSADRLRPRAPPCRPRPDEARVAGPVRAGPGRSQRPEASDAAVRLDLAQLKNGSHRTRISQPSADVSVRSNDTCRLSQGSAIRRWIFARPSPTGSIGSRVECNTRLRMSS